MTTLASHTGHYGADYFAWQREVSEFGAWANRFKFDLYIRASDHVLDFGCGGGYLLGALEVRERLGIEINPVAREAAHELGLDVRPTAEEVPDALGRRNHIQPCTGALHKSAVGELETLLPKMRPGGRFVCVVPSETARRQYDPTDPNHHLFYLESSEPGSPLQ